MIDRLIDWSIDSLIIYPIWLISKINRIFWMSILLNRWLMTYKNALLLCFNVVVVVVFSVINSVEFTYSLVETTCIVLGRCELVWTFTLIYCISLVKYYCWIVWRNICYSQGGEVEMFQPQMFATKFILTILRRSFCNKVSSSHVLEIVHESSWIEFRTFAKWLTILSDFQMKFEDF